MPPPLLLVPTPRALSFTDGEAVVPAEITVSGADAAILPALPRARPSGVGWCRCAIAPDAMREAGDEAYRLVVAPDGVRIAARTGTGLRWGLTTLAQLLRQCPQRIPCLVIEDAPRFAHRGFMLDISRDRVPTMASLRGLIDALAATKTNRLQLYCEHAFAYPGHEAVWRAADPITADELRALDAYAAARGVALDANQNCLGHFERWLRVPAYAHLGEIPAWTVGDGWYVEPSTLAANDPEVLTLIDGLLAAQLPCCSGAFCNIGCDEPWDLGRGRSAAAVAREGAKTVFARHVRSVAAMAHRLGKRPQFWCDPEPREDDSLPRDLVALVWGYEDCGDFAIRLQAHGAQGRETWVCPGTSNWTAITSRTWNRRGNLDRAAREGLAAGSTGLLNTEWGDSGHRQQWPLTILGAAEGAQTAWASPGGHDASAIGLHLFGAPETGEWLAALGDADAPLSRGDSGRRRSNRTALMEELEANILDPGEAGELPAWEATGARLAGLAATLPTGGDALVRRECAHTVAVAQLACRRALVRRQGAPTGERRAILADLCAIIAEHRALWLARSRYGGLEDSCQWYRQQAARW